MASFGQRYSASGAPLGPEFRVNTYTTSFQGVPSVVEDSTGNFVVVWHSYEQDGSNDGVFGQRIASTGTALGPEFRVNTYTTSYQYAPSVGTDSAGNFVVVWNGDLQDGAGFGVFGQRYTGSGAPLGPEFRVNASTRDHQSGPSVAIDSSGNFVVVWDSGSFPSRNIFGQRYSSSGSPLGPEFRVNTFMTQPKFNSSVAADSAGNFVVVWQSYGQDGSNYGVFGQRYAGSGTPLGPEFRVNTHTTAGQRNPSVAVDSSGNSVVVWSSDLQDGSSGGVFGQRYNMIVPVELMRFRVE